MRLSEAIRSDKGVYPGSGVIRRERATWYFVTKLKVTSGAIDVADLGAFPGEDSVRVGVPKGTYLIEARLIDFSGSLCVSRIRARLEQVTAKLGSQCGEVSVDFGCIAIGDIGQIQSVLNAEDLDELNEESRDLMQTEFCRKCSIEVAGQAIKFVVSKAGLGDGRYPVFELKNQNRRVGFEVELIQNGHILA